LSATQVTRIALAAILVLLALWVAADFLVALAWAVVIALATWPLYRRFAERMPGRRQSALAPLAFTLMVGALLFVPMMLAVHQAAQESQVLLRSLTHVRENGLPVPGWLPSLPFGEQTVRWWQANLADPRGAVEWLGSNVDKQAEVAWTRALGAQLLHRLFLFFLALVALYALLRHGAWIAQRVLETADRLIGDPGERLASRMAETVRGTVNGTLIVALAEGAIIGCAYAVAGLPSPLLFALLTAAFAMVPLGAWVVFSAAALLLLQAGQILAAAGIFSFGAAVMIAGDTFVWPALVGKEARLPFLAALIGIFGGVQTFGLIGLVVGPMIIATLWSAWREWLGTPERAAK
jgi:predicted PurR-regulated permease PerM